MYTAASRGHPAGKSLSPERPARLNVREAGTRQSQALCWQEEVRAEDNRAKDRNDREAAGRRYGQARQSRIFVS